MRYETPDEFFKRSPGKTIADYYQLRKKIQSGPSKNKPIINKAEEASKAGYLSSAAAQPNGLVIREPQKAVIAEQAPGLLA